MTTPTSGWHYWRSESKNSPMTFPGKPTNFAPARMICGNRPWRSSKGVQALSHELHSSKLEYLGLVAAIRTFCREFGAHQNVEIVFETHDVVTPMPPDASLSLFRVLQEALANNAALYSGVKRFEVRLWGTSNEIHLTVSDSGVGFDVEAATKGPGLGLISMRERVELMKGSLSVESQTGRGTTIHALVPVAQEGYSMGASG